MARRLEPGEGVAARFMFAVTSMRAGANAGGRCRLGALLLTLGVCALAGGLFDEAQAARANTITYYTDKSINNPTAIVAGPDGALWFTNFAGTRSGGSACT